MIYLSILGKVYDVTAGEEYYSSRLKAPYAIFAGRDGVVPFITGVFTEEEAMKATDELTDQQMNSLRTEWVSFYKKEEKYPYLGKLAGKYYNVDGTPTEELQRIHQRWRNYKPPESKKKRRKKPKSV